MANLTGVGVFFIIMFLILLFGCTGWLLYTHFRAKKLGLPQPTLSSYNPFSHGNIFSDSGHSHTGVIGWVNNKIRVLKNRNNRSAVGGYEEPLTSNVRSRANNRGFGPLDPDEAWDSRVGNEADVYTPYGYSEELELGPNQRVGAPPKYEESRGRNSNRKSEQYIGSSQAELDRRYDDEMGRTNNPFADTAEPSNLGSTDLSSRHIVTAEGPAQQKNTRLDSPSRRSMFLEDI